MPISLREGTILERSLRGSLESLSLLLWAITALFRYFGDLGHIPKGDPLFDQFQRSISKVSENIASVISSSAAFVTLKRGKLTSPTLCLLLLRHNRGSSSRTLCSTPVTSSLHHLWMRHVRRLGTFLYTSLTFSLSRPSRP